MKGWHNYTKHATDGVPNTAFSTMPGTPFMAQLLALPYAMVACTGLVYAAASACTAEETMTIVGGTSGDDAYQVLGPLTQGCNDCVQDAGNDASMLRENCWPVVSGNQCHSTLSFTRVCRGITEASVEIYHEYCQSMPHATGLRESPAN